MRYTLTPEEFALVEKLRAKNQNTLGYNEGLTIAIVAVNTYTSTMDRGWEGFSAWRQELATHIDSLRRELKS